MANKIIDFINSMGISTPDNPLQSFIKSSTKDIPMVGSYINNGIPSYDVSKNIGSSPNTNEVMQDVSDVGTGLLNLPRNAMLHPLKTAAGALMAPVNAVTDFATTTAPAMLGNEEARKRFEKHPVSKTLNTAATAMGAINAVNTAAQSRTSDIKESSTALPKISQEIPKQAVDNYMKMFEVPKRSAQRMSISPEDSVRTAIKDGITNVKDLNELQGVVDSVTGENGAFPKINKIILDDIKKPVDIESIYNSQPAAETIASRAINQNLKGSPKGLVNEVNARVAGSFPEYGMQSIIPENTALPSDLYTTSQKLGTLERMYKNKAYDAQGDLINPDMERASNAIGEIKNNINDVLDKAIDPKTYQVYKSDPRVQAELSRLPEGLANRWLSDAKQFRDGRSIQAPYVNLGRMIEMTQDAGMTAFSKLREGIVPASQKVADFITQPRQTIGGALVGGVQKALSPFLDKTPEQINQDLTSGVASSSAPSGVVGTAQATGNAARGAIGQATSPLSALANLPEIAQNPSAYVSNNPLQIQGALGGSQAGQQAQNEESNNASRLPQIPTLSLSGNVSPVGGQSPVQSLKPDVQGNYSFPDQQGGGTYMTTQEYLQGIQQHPPGDPERNNIEAAYQESQKQAQGALTSGVKNFMNKSQPILNGVASFRDQTLPSLPTDILKQFKQDRDLEAYISNPNNPYAQQLARVGKLNNLYSSVSKDITGESPTDTQLIHAGDSSEQIRQKVDEMLTTIIETHGQFQEPYAAVVSPSGTVSSQNKPTPLQRPTAPSEPSFAPIVGGGLPAIQ